MKKTSILAMAMAMILVLSQSVFCWGPDIPIWTEGTVNCFDVDYNVN